VQDSRILVVDKGIGFSSKKGETEPFLTISAGTLMTPELAIFIVY